MAGPLQATTQPLQQLQQLPLQWLLQPVPNTQRMLLELPLSKHSRPTRLQVKPLGLQVKAT